MARQKKQEISEDFISALSHLLKTHPSKVTVNSICKRAGYSKRTFYNLYGSVSVCAQVLLDAMKADARASRESVRSPEQFCEALFIDMQDFRSFYDCFSRHLNDWKYAEAFAECIWAFLRRYTQDLSVDLDPKVSRELSEAFAMQLQFQIITDRFWTLEELTEHFDFLLRVLHSLE